MKKLHRHLKKKWEEKGEEKVGGIAARVYAGKEEDKGFW